MSVKSENFHVGEPWYPEVTVTNDKTGAPGKPGEVKFAVYSPAAWKLGEETGTYTPTANVLLPEIEASVFEGLAIDPLTEPGIWRGIVNATAPNKGVEPTLITVKPAGEA